MSDETDVLKRLREQKKKIDAAIALASKLKKPGGYEADRDKAGEMFRTRSASSREVAIPAVVNQERRDAASASFRVFCETYGSAVFFRGWSDDHIRVIEKFERIGATGGRMALAMPRLSGKTVLAEWFVLFCMLTGKRRFPVLVGPDDEHAGRRLHTIKTVLEGNDLLAEDFPEVCTPIRALEGITQRRLLHNGKPINMMFTGKQIVLPNIPGPACSAIVTITGLLGSFRGLSHMRPDGQSIRPDLVILDDPQTDQSAKSKAMCDEREAVIKGAVMGLGGLGTRIAVIAPVTVIKRGDLADRLLNKSRNPGWESERTKLINRLPDRLDLWDQYAAIRRDDSTAATKFYAQHQDAMDEGAEPAWRENFDESELSAIQHAMNLRIDDFTSFQAEYQNDPEDPEDDGRAFDADELTASPAAFRDWLQLPNGESFGQSLDPFQAADFAALDAAFTAMVKREPCDRRRIWLERPTGHAKTYDSAVMVAWVLAFSPRRITGVVAGMDKPAARRLISTLKGIVSENTRLQERLKVGAMKAENPATGSSIEVISSEAKSAMSLGEPDFLICDQLATWSDPKRWTAMMAATGNRHSVLLVTSQVGMRQGECWQWTDREIARQSDAWYFASNGDASWVNREFIEFQRSALANKTFKRVYGNEWTKAIDNALLGDLLIAESIEPDCLWRGGMPPAGIRTGRLHVGFDVGRNRHLSVIAVLEEVGELLFLRALVTMFKVDFPAQQARVAEFLRLPNVASCSMDRGVIGAEIFERLNKQYPIVRGVVCNGPVQGMLADRLRYAMTERALRIPDDPALITDLGSVEEINNAASGRPIVRTEISVDGTHADRFWGVALAVNGVPRKKAPTAPAAGVRSRYA